MKTPASKKKPKVARKITRRETRLLDEARLLGLVSAGHNFGVLAKEFKVPKSAIYAIVGRAKK